jgi:glycosyltransferase involved in cell wall biosynthesis
VKLALLPWGNVIEDFLDPLGLSLEDFRDEMTGGWLFGYVDAFSKAGIETVLVCVSRGVERPCRWRHLPTGARLWVLPRGQVQAALARLGARESLRAFAATPLPALGRVLRLERCGAIVCQEYEYPRFDACVLLGRALGLPVFATFQGGDRSPTFERPLRSLALRKCNGVVIGPDSEARRVLALYALPEAKVARVFNPLDVGAWNPSCDERASARRELGIPSKARVVGWHGRVEMWTKGVDLLLDAWGALREYGTLGADDRLILVGTGPSADGLRRRIADADPEAIVWVNEYVLERDRIRRYLAAIDIYCFPSRHEGFPVAPVEAMACGLPVVATAAPGIDDIFEHGEKSGGIVVPVDARDALGCAIGRLLSDPNERHVLGERARSRAREAFSLEAVGAQLRDFFVGRGLRAI